MRKVKFPQYIDRARMIFVFESDMVLVFSGSTILLLWIFSKVFSLLLVVPFAFYAGWNLMKLYNKARYEMSPGFIRHFFYRVGLFKPKQDFEKYPELKSRDDENFYPSGYISDFSD